MNGAQFFSFGVSLVCLVAAFYSQLIAKKYENVPYWMGLAIINLILAKT